MRSLRLLPSCSSCGHGALTAAAADVDPAAPEPFFFRVSPITATAEQAVGATRYAVTVTNAPVGNAPFIRWYLDLKPGSTGRPAPTTCFPVARKRDRAGTCGRTRGSHSCGTTGQREATPRGRPTAATKRSWESRLPGRVTVVFENDSETCTASFVGTRERSAGLASGSLRSSADTFHSPYHVRCCARTPVRARGSTTFSDAPSRGRSTARSSPTRSARS